MIDVKPFIAFAEVLEKGSMNLAAQSLDITPSAVSQHISRLERDYQVKLLSRHARKITPTDAGLALAEHCQRLRHSLKDITQTLENLKTEAVGELHIALPSGFATSPKFTQALNLLAARHPNIRLQLHFDDTAQDLIERQIDLAILPQYELDKARHLIARRLARWQQQICASPRYLSRHTPIASPDDLYHHNWIYDEPIHLTLQKGSHTHALRITDTTHCNQAAAVQALTVAGLGLSVQLSGEIAGKVADGQLQIVLPDWQLPSMDFYLVTPYRVQSAKTEAMIKILMECFLES
ncbi:LysR family transcriptional regulator [Conservatibacter flavescens]|uniref:LysR family transcriptional regulator n=1 Tax=Conservatibacter flavescens TaxID=28161 RepID=A0A2M8S5C4_9PAST|nr:LysR family transcriptional regulator [Conservatibacter flavescens]PJG86345.1 LysR family transcriptional regulator [Conservatibacter flavescens]